MKSVLVTGATTPLGVALVKKLLGDERIEEVIAVAHPDESSLVGTADERYRFVATDLRRSRNLRNLLYGDARRATTVIHTASHRSPRAVGPRAHRLNVEATRLLLALSEEHPTIERFIYRSFGDVYRIDGQHPCIIDEYEPLQLAPRTPQWIRDRVEADLTVCTRTGLSRMNIAVLRFAECVAPRMGSQLYDYLSATTCFVPWGFDPILNVISLDDMVRALIGAAESDAEGIFNIPGADTLSLTESIRLSGRRAVPAVGALMSPLYALRAFVQNSEFRYALNDPRFHYGSVLSGRRAKQLLGYEPRHGVVWPRATEASGRRAAEPRPKIERAPASGSRPRAASQPDQAPKGAASAK